MAFLYRHAGVAGLLSLSMTAAVMTLLLGAYTHRRTGVGEPLSLLLLALLLLGVSSQLTVVRPQLFSLVLFAALLAVLNDVQAGASRGVMWLAPIFALWANLHGGWIVGLGSLGLWLATPIAGTRLSWRWRCAAGLVAVLSTLANPYGWHLWFFLNDTVGLGRKDIADWQPLVTSLPQFVPWTLAGVAVLAAIWRGRLRGLWAAVPAVLLGLMALKVWRLNAFFVIATVMTLAPVLASFGPRRLPLSRPPSPSELLVVGLMAAVGMSVSLHFAWQAAACLPVDSTPPLLPEREAVVFARQNGLTGRLVSYFDYGEYAIWHLAPALQVWDDGRRETIYIQDGARVPPEFLPRREAGLPR